VEEGYSFLATMTQATARGSSTAARPLLAAARPRRPATRRAPYRALATGGLLGDSGPPNNYKGAILFPGKQNRTLVVV